MLVYGQWPGQPAHIAPFFTSVLSDAQMDQARATPWRDFHRRPLEVLFVGRLTSAKNVDILLQALARLDSTGEAWRLCVLGDGPARPSLEQMVAALGISDRVEFVGAVPPERVLEFYRRSAVLVLASDTEGWPKAIAEAMAFGLVCVGANRGLVPQMLGEGRGLVVEPRDVAGLAQALSRVLGEAEAAAVMAERGATWARQFTLEGFGRALQRLLETTWKTRLAGTVAGDAVMARSQPA